MISQSFQLVMKSGPTPGKIFPLDRNEINLGRDISNQILINDAEVSRHHLRLILQAGGYVIEDLGSTNGTFVNGQRLVGLRTLHSGDTITAGENVSLVFETVPPEVEATRVSPAAPSSPPQLSRPSPAVHPAAVVLPQEATEGVVQEALESISQPLRPSAGLLREKTGIPRTWLIVGCSVLAGLCLIVLAVLWYIDANYLWCRVLPFWPACQ